MKTHLLKQLLVPKEPYSSLLKAVGLGAALSAQIFIGPALLGAAPFFIVAAIIYFSHYTELMDLTLSYWAGIFLSSFTLFKIKNSLLTGLAQSISSWLFVVVSIIFFWSLFELEGWFQTKRFTLLPIQNSYLIGLSSASFLPYFSQYSVGASFLFLFGVFYSVLYEFFWLKDFDNRNTYLSSAALSLLGVELAYLLRLLPLSIFHVTLLLVIFISLGRNLVISNLEGKISRGLILRQLTVLIILSLLVFLSVNI
ncbi:MAG: hypothetical protein ABEI53_02475 [Candidatus Magasanikbacteria bacterium]